MAKKKPETEPTAGSLPDSVPTAADVDPTPADGSEGEDREPSVALLVIGPDDKVDSWAGDLPRLSRKNSRHIYSVPESLVDFGIDAAKTIELHAERTHVAACAICGGVAIKYDNQSRGDLWFYRCEQCYFTFSSAAPRS